MTESTPPFVPESSALPEKLIVFAAPGVVLLPRARLPLSLMDPRLMAMIEEALKSGRTLGIVQPTGQEETEAFSPLYSIGCAGRIVSFSEGDDGRFLVTLAGTCRFRVAQEGQTEQGLRWVRPLWEGFEADLGPPPEDAPFDRARLMAVLRDYFKMNDIEADWSVVEQTTDENLISSLVMVCPLETSEKQALVEVPDLAARAELLTALLEMACMPQQDPDNVRH